VDTTYYTALLAGYAAALVGWLVAAQLLAGHWPRREGVAPAHPVREIAFALLAGVAVLGIGQLYMRGWLLPRGGRFGELTEAANQLLIFSPLLLLPLIRGQGSGSAWLPKDHIVLRVLVGVLLAALAMAVFTAVHPGSDRWLDVLPRVYAPANAGEAAQVWCEDVSIAVVFVRVRALLGQLGSTLAVAVLFAAAHVPALLAGDAAAGELAHLGADAGLGAAIILALQRSADIWWFWPVHFATDMLQFHSGAPPPA
jgi:hypothetical protein